MTTNFNITKNVTDAFDLIIPDYVENTTPVARITGNIDMSITPSLITNLELPLVLISPTISITPTTAITGATPYTYYGTAYDSYLFGNVSGQYTFYDEQDSLIIGTVYEMGCKAWIPFIVTQPQGTTIALAVINFISTTNSYADPVKIKIGCERSSNAINPTSYDDLNSRVMSSNFTTDTNVLGWVAGTTYSFDVTTAVQEILNRTDPVWVTGNTMAIMVMNYGSEPDRRRHIASYENTVYSQPYLVISV